MQHDLEVETEVAELLTELSSVQDEMLQVLSAKRQRMAENDVAGMESLQAQEEALCGRLQQCHDRRSELLAKAQNDSNESISSLSQLVEQFPQHRRNPMLQRIDASTHRMRLLQHQSLTNWVLAQRTILHLSQLLEIIATGGRLQPTYGRSEELSSGGSLVDREV